MLKPSYTNLQLKNPPLHPPPLNQVLNKYEINEFLLALGHLLRSASRFYGSSAK